MASTYVNNLRLNEMATGDASGSWGTNTNTNLEIIGQATAWGTRAIANASTDNITIADGALDADRCLGLKLTGGGQACTVTLLPNTSSKTWIMYNATSAALTFTCGSGANVIIPAGQTKVIATDGLGSGGVVHDLLTAVNLAGTTQTAALTNAGALSNQGTVTVGVDDTGYDVQFFGATSGAYMLWDESADDLKLVGAAGLTVAGDIDVDGTTNLDVVDIDGAVDMASTLTVNDSVTLQSSGSSKPVLTIKNTNADTTPPTITFQKDSASPADGDEVALFNFYGDDSGGNVAAYAGLKVVADDVTDGTEDGSIRLRSMIAGTIADRVVVGTTLNSSVKIEADAGIDIDNINIDGTTIALSSGNLLLDVAGNINLDADGGDVIISDAGTEIAHLSNSSSDFKIESKVSDKDIIFRGNDGGSGITALTLDMSDAGTASFNHDIKFGDNGKAIFGASSDLQIYHDGTNSYVDEVGTGDLRLCGDNLGLMNAGHTEFYLYATVDGAVDIKHNNLTKLSTSATGITVTGTIANTSTAKVWVNFNGTGTVAIGDSHNVSSITDNGTGDYSVNFTTAMGNANYSCVTSAARTINNAFMSSIYYSSGLATGSARVRCWEDAGAAQDPNVYCVTIFGD